MQNSVSRAINQRITSSTTLMEIIKRFNLYSDKRKKMSTEEIVDEMRKKHIKLDTISANVIDPQTRRPGSATIAFTVSFEGERPDVVPAGNQYAVFPVSGRKPENW